MTGENFRPNPIKRLECFGTDNGGVALHSSMQQWFDEVTDVLNFLLASHESEAEKLGKVIHKLSAEGWWQHDG